MTDEERQSAMDFVVELTAKNSVQVEKLLESHQAAERRLVKTEHRLDPDERILGLMIRAGRRERQTRSEADERLTNALVELAEAQKRTEDSIAHIDGKLDALVDIVRQQQNGRSS
jgi:DNA recombination-dependent growth factor C